MNIASTSAHGTLARTGSAKTASRVLRCLPRTDNDIELWYQALARKDHLKAGVLDRDADGRIVFPYDEIHVDFVLRAA
jgi:hypothetical protein